MEKKNEETVKITLFHDDERYNAPLFVGVNGKSYLIKRGEEVEIPKSVSEVIENSNKQKDVAAAAREMAKEVKMIG